MQSTRLQRQQPVHLVQELAEHTRADAAARRRAVARGSECVNLVKKDDGRRGRARLGVEQDGRMGGRRRRRTRRRGARCRGGARAEVHICVCAYMPPTLAKSEATFCSLSPTYLEKSSGPLTAMKLVRASPARAWHRRARALRRGLHAYAGTVEERGRERGGGERGRGGAPWRRVSSSSRAGRRGAHRAAAALQGARRPRRAAAATAPPLAAPARRIDTPCTHE